MDKITGNKGTARLIVIMALIAVALGLAIVIPIILNKSDEELRLVDERQMSTAERQAKIEYQLTNEGFTAVFETETKKFVNQDVARRTVEPYGATKETEGKYLLVTVSDSGDVTMEWTEP